MAIIIGTPPYPDNSEDQKYFNLTHRIGNEDYSLSKAKDKAEMMEEKYRVIYVTKKGDKYRLYWL
jgi:hypothetical protein